jgi:hypothetical protein
MQGSHGVATVTFIAPQFNNALGLKGLQEFLTRFIARRQTTRLARWCHRARQGSLPGSI